MRVFSSFFLSSDQFQFQIYNKNNYYYGVIWILSYLCTRQKCSFFSQFPKRSSAKPFKVQTNAEHILRYLISYFRMPQSVKNNMIINPLNKKLKKKFDFMRVFSSFFRISDQFQFQIYNNNNYYYYDVIWILSYLRRCNLF